MQNFAANFDQRLECAAPKRWSKYATTNSWEINFSRIKFFETNFLELKGIAEKMNWETEQMKCKIKLSDTKVYHSSLDNLFSYGKPENPVTCICDLTSHKKCYPN